MSLFLSVSVVWCGAVAALRGEVGGRLHLLPHLGISRVAHLPHIERRERERETLESGKEKEILGKERERERERNLGAR